VGGKDEARRERRKKGRGQEKEEEEKKRLRWGEENRGRAKRGCTYTLAVHSRPIFEQWNTDVALLRRLIFVIAEASKA